MNYNDDPTIVETSVMPEIKVSSTTIKNDTENNLAMNDHQNISPAVNNDFHGLENSSSVLFSVLNILSPNLEDTPPAFTNSFSTDKFNLSTVDNSPDTVDNSSDTVDNSSDAVDNSSHAVDNTSEYISTVVEDRSCPLSMAPLTVGDRLLHCSHHNPCPPKHFCSLPETASEQASPFCCPIPTEIGKCIDKMIN